MQPLVLLLLLTHVQAGLLWFEPGPLSHQHLSARPTLASASLSARPTLASASLSACLASSVACLAVCSATASLACKASISACNLASSSFAEPLFVVHHLWLEF